MIKETIKIEYKGETTERVDVILAENTEISRSRIKSLADANLLIVNGVSSKANKKCNCYVQNKLQDVDEASRVGEIRSALCLCK